jgi:predicted transcriptional regulator
LLQNLQINQGRELMPREKIVINYIQNNPGCKSGEISKALGITKFIVIRLLKNLINNGFVQKHGIASATNYTIT